MEKLNEARNYEANAAEKTIGEKPVYHVSTPVGWLNDPNGFSMYQGNCHLFFQYHPYSTHWGPMHWGHYITKDFIRWTLCPCALAPDMEYDKDGCFSGTALEWNGKHVLMYTGVKEAKYENKTEVRQTQCIAVGDGVHYVKEATNPVIKADILPEGSSQSDFRDPKIWRNEKGFWSLVGSVNEDGSGQLALFHSENLIEWKFVKILDYCRNEYGKMWECPDFFPLDGKQILVVSPQFMQADGGEFHNGNNSIYFVGNFNTETLEWKRDIPHMIDFGLDFYAPETVKISDGRRIMIGWMQSWDNYLTPDTYSWSGTMTIPRELSLKDGKLIQTPVRELERYRKNQVIYEKLHMSKDEGKQQLEGIRGRVLDMRLTLSGNNYEEFSIILAADEIHQTVIRYDRSQGMLTTDRTRCGMWKDMISVRSIPLKLGEQEELELRILLDKNSIELFANHGACVMSTLIYTPLSADNIYFETDGILKMDIEKYDIVVE